MNYHPLLYVWNRKLELGIPRIDDDHREFLSLMNDFHAAVANGESAARRSIVYQRLAHYAAHHFAAEEGFFDEVEYPGLATHRKQHAWFLAHLSALCTSSGDNSRQTAGFMRNWFVDHITEADRQYVAWAATSGAELAELYAGAEQARALMRRVSA